VITEIVRRLKVVFISLPAVMLAGTVGYTVIEGWPVFDSFYMTVITLATIGYGEVHTLSTAGRVFTIFLSCSGLGVAAFAFSSLTAFIVGGELRDVLRRKQMKSAIEKLKDHFIVCGAGFTGTAIFEELRKTHRPFLIIEKEAAKADDLQEDGYLVIMGDALRDEVLEEAGIGRARGIFCVLDSDRDNVFVVLTARGMNPRLRIISEVHDDKVRDKLLRSGADAVVSSRKIGGLRLASEMVRPAAVGFLDSMIRDRESTYRFEEIRIPDDSPVLRQSLRAIEVTGGRKPLVVGIKEPKTGRYTINPSPDRPIEAGDFLVVLGDKEQVHRLQEAVEA